MHEHRVIVTSRERPSRLTQAMTESKGADMKLKPSTTFSVLFGLAAFMTGISAVAQTNYRVETLPNLGGADAAVSSINNRGWASGAADFAGDNVSHAALWVDGNLTDLGSFGGLNINSAIAWGVKA